MNPFQVLRQIVFPTKSFTAALARGHGTDKRPTPMNGTLMTLEVAHVAEVFNATIGLGTFVRSGVLVHVFSFRLVTAGHGLSWMADLLPEC